MVTAYGALVAVHIASIAVALGAIVSQPLVSRAIRSEAPESVSALARAHRRLENLLVAPAATLTLVTGAGLATLGGLWGEIWVSLPLALLVFVLTLHGAYVAPTQRRLERLADPSRQTEAGAPAEAVARRLAIASYLSGAAIVLALALMVLKPS